ncbi:MAG: histidine kinase dimerization/phosphoacceptor domain -containing protein, partial [Melioribacteraceae bacterium]
LPDSNDKEGKMIFSSLVSREVFHKSFRVSFSGIDWGWIHIGLSLDNYITRLKTIRNDTIGLTIIISLLGFLMSFIFAKKLTKPIRILDKTTKMITEGDLEAKAIVDTGDELQSLAASFNKMTDAVRTAKEELENRVEERTAALANINKVLLQEISERKKIEKSLQSSIAEKDVLIKEIHHRVKNNLQIISSLLFLQYSNITDDETLNIFRDSQSRIKSMALVHEKLYQSKELSKINFSEYLHNLSTYVFQTYRNLDKNFKFIFDLDEIFLTIDTAIPLGLILNELLTNAFKYAFINDNTGGEAVREIRIEAKKSDGKIILTVSDNGVGLPKDFSITESESLGLKLVQNLTEQINGELIIGSDSGASFTIKLKHNPSH